MVENFSDNVFIRSTSAFTLTQGNSNFIICKYVGQITSGSNNIFIGDYTGRLTVADNNVIMGSMTGGKITGSGNVMIGNNAGQYTECSNKLFISNSIHHSTHVLIYGEFDKKTLMFNAAVGIGTTQSDKNLHVIGDARIIWDIYYETETDKYTKVDYAFRSKYANYIEPSRVENSLNQMVTYHG